MVRVATILLASLLVVWPGAVRADDPPAGTYRVVLFLPEGGSKTPWIIKLEAKEGKWVGTILAQEPGLPPKSTLEEVTLVGDVLRFRLVLTKEVSFRFESKLPREKGSNLLGSVIWPNRQVFRVHMEPTELASLDPFEMDKELVAKQSGTYEVLQAAKNLLNNAAFKKAKPEEVRAWADKVAKTAELYGPLMHRSSILEIVELLGKQEGFAPIALQYARQAERMIDDAKDPPGAKKRILAALANALEKAGKSDEAKEVQARNDKILYVVAKPFPGRKSKSNRAVLVELFTGAECPPCVAADLAFDSLRESYKPSEVILLQYHLHVPGPDPLTNKDTEDRQGFYGEEQVEGTPAILFNGMTGPRGGGLYDEAQRKYEKYVEVLSDLLEKPAEAAVKVSATRKGARIDIKAEVSELQQPGNDLRLHLVLVEETVAYVGGNKIPLHHSVVRAIPTGKEGLALTEKTVSKTATVDLDELRKKLSEYLTKVAQDAQETTFPTKGWPLELKKLKVVAFVQNKANKDILQAVQTEVPVE